MVDVLVVEDHDMLRATMVQVLTDGGFALREAADGKAALAQIAEQAPDVVFLDLALPGMSGQDILKEIKGNPETAGIKVIVVTGQGEEGKRGVLELGADAYFRKPYSPFGLVQAVEQVTRERPSYD